jgi:hypothetical protein
MHNAVGYAKFRLVKRLRITPRFEKAFDRLTEHLNATGITADQYFGALTSRAIRSRGQFRPWTNNLGLPHYNQFVTQELAKHAERMDGQTTRADAGFNRLRPKHGVLTDAELEQDVLKSITYRRQYHTMSNRHFWLLFSGEFSGAYLYVSDDFRRCRLVHFLTDEQRSQWDLLADDESLASQIQARCSTIAARVGTRGWPRSVQKSSQQKMGIKQPSRFMLH